MSIDLARLLSASLARCVLNSAHMKKTHYFILHIKCAQIAHVLMLPCVNNRAQNVLKLHTLI